MLTSRPDGKKKAYVRLTSDFDALEVANKVSGKRSICSGTLADVTDRLHLVVFWSFACTLYHGLPSPARLEAISPFGPCPGVLIMPLESRTALSRSMNRNRPVVVHEDGGGQPSAVPVAVSVFYGRVGARGSSCSGAIHVQSWASFRLSRGMFWLPGSARTNPGHSVTYLSKLIKRSASWSSVS